FEGKCRHHAGNREEESTDEWTSPRFADDRAFLDDNRCDKRLAYCRQRTCPFARGLLEGAGIVSHKGANDRVECRVRYKRASDRSFSYTATCAMESGKYDLTGSVTNTSGSRYSGTVVGGSEGSRETGRVFLIQRGKLLSVSVTSRSGSARMTLFKLS